jgi:hypothetical protein
MECFYGSPCAQKSLFDILCTYPFVSALDPFVSALDPFVSPSTHLFFDPFQFVFLATRFRSFDLE